MTRGPRRITGEGDGDTRGGPRRITGEGDGDTRGGKEGVIDISGIETGDTRGGKEGVGDDIVIRRGGVGDDIVIRGGVGVMIQGEARCPAAGVLRNLTGGLIVFTGVGLTGVVALGVGALTGVGALAGVDAFAGVPAGMLA
jgi:hypothetical protein